MEFESELAPSNASTSSTDESSDDPSLFTAPPPPEAISCEAFHALHTSMDSDDLTSALQMLSIYPTKYSACTKHLAALFTRCLTGDDCDLHYAARTALRALAGVRSDDRDLIADLFISLTATIIESVREKSSPASDHVGYLSDLVMQVPGVASHHLPGLLGLCSQDPGEVVRDVPNLLSSLAEQSTEAFTLPEHRRAIVECALHSLTVAVDEGDTQYWQGEFEMIRGWGEEMDYARHGLATVFKALAEKNIVTEIVGQATLLLRHENWPHRHAAVVALGVIAEDGCDPLIGDVVAAVEGALSDEHPRVRNSACDAISKWNFDTAPFISSSFPDSLLTLLREDSRVAWTASAVVSKYIGERPKIFSSCHAKKILAFIVSCMERVSILYGDVVIEEWRAATVEILFDVLARLIERRSELGVTEEGLDEAFERLLSPLINIVAATNPCLENSPDGVEPVQEDDAVLSVFSIAAHKEVRRIAVDILRVLSRFSRKERLSSSLPKIVAACITAISTLFPDDCANFMATLEDFCAEVGDLMTPYLPSLVPLLTEKARVGASTVSKKPEGGQTGLECSQQAQKLLQQLLGEYRPADAEETGLGGEASPGPV